MIVPSSRPDPSLSDRERRLDEAIAEYLLAAEAGRAPDRRAFLARYADLADDLAAFFEDEDCVRGLAGTVPMSGEDARGRSPFQAGKGAEADAGPGVGGELGDFVLLEEIAAGGMGVVFKARQKSLNRVVALKTIRPSAFRPGDDAAARFRIEAEAVARLDHPGIVPIFEMGELAGYPYLCLKLIDGGDLDRHLGRFRNDPAASARLMVEVARAVHYAHQRGILHRDLKPSNILLDGQGRPHVTDFGLARCLEHDSRITQTGLILGTPSYMAPEQVAGRRSEVTTAADVYGLGAVLYTLLAGRPPFKADSVYETLRQVREQEPASPRTFSPGVDRDLEAICLKCLEKDPRGRYPLAAAMAVDLDHWLDGEPIAARPSGRAERAWRWYRRNRLVANISVGVACLIVAFAVIAGISAVGYSFAASSERVQRELAQAREGDIRRRLVQLAVGRGIKVMDEGDSTGALPWFAEAMVFDSDDPQAEATHRLRLGTLMGQCPSLDALFTHPGPIKWATLDRSGRLVATASADGTARAWDAATGAAATPPLRHDGLVNRAEFRGDGRRLVTASDDGFVRIWDVDGGRPEASAAPAPRLAHGSPVKIAMFSPDGRRVMSGGSDGTIRTWDATDGSPIGGAYRLGSPLLDLAQSPDGSRIATGGDPPGGTRLCRVEGGRLVAFVALKHGKPVRRVAFSADGTRLATSCMDGTARVWDVRTGEPVTAPIVHGQWLAHAEFSPDGSRLATASEDGTARVWDARTGQPIGSAVALVNHASGVNEVSFSPDGSRLVTAGNDGTARVWDAATGLPLSPPLYHGTSLLRARFTPDGYRVLTVGSDPTARIWDLTGVGAPAVTVEGAAGMNYACFDPSGRWIATAGNDGTARVWDARNGEPVSPPLRHRGGVVRVAFAVDSRLIATAGRDGLARVWDAAGGWSPTCTLQHAGTVYDVRFSPDGARLATASADGAARIWDAATGSAIVPRLEHGQAVLGLAFSPDGRYLATAGNDGTARVWDAETGRPVLVPLRHDAPVACVAFSPDGRALLTACSDESLAVLNARQWDLTTGHPLGPALRHGDGVLWAAYSPDGRRIATASEDRTARVWDAATGEPLTRPLTHQHQVLMVAFSPDSRRVATCSLDGTARVWDAATGEPVSPSLSHRDRVKVGSVSFSSDGRSLVTAGQDGTARIWDLPRDNRPSDILFLHAKVLAGRRIDQTEAELPLDAAELAESWDRLRASGPLPSARPSGSRAEALSRIAWHRREVRRLEQSHQSLAVSWHLERLGALLPGDPSIDGRLAAAYEVTGDWGRLVRLASRTIAAGSDDVEVRTRRGWARFHLTHADDAAVNFRQALKQDPKSAPARLGLFTAQASLGRLSEAESIWASLIDDQDEWRQDRLAATSDHLRRLGNDNPDGWWFWRARGLVQMQTGRPDQAESDYGRAIQIEPDDVWSYMGRGLARKKLGRADGALADLARAIELEPRRAVAWRWRGEIHGARGGWDEAARDFARWADLGGEPSALFWYDHAALRLHARARGDYRRTCMIMWECFRQSDDPEIAGNLARACVLGPDPGIPADQVVELARRAAGANSRNPWSLSTLGAALFRAGKFDEAIARLDEARTVDLGWSGAPVIEVLRAMAARERARRTPRGGGHEATHPEDESPIDATKLLDRMKRAKARWNFALEAEILIREHNERLSGPKAKPAS